MTRSASSKANRQITSFDFDVVRAQVPKIKLDDVFEKKDAIATIVESELAQPGNLTSLTEQIRNSMIEADQTVREPAVNGRPLPASSTVSSAEPRYPRTAADHHVSTETEDRHK